MKAMLVSLLCAFTACASPQRRADSAAAKLKVLVVTGGHGFQAGPFFKMFADNPEVATTAASQGQAAEVYDRADLFDYDVLVLYDAPSEITDAQKQRFLALFDRGLGVVVLHHALLSYQRWPEYERAVGGKYLLDVETRGDAVTPESTYEPRAEIPVTVAAPEHPVAAGLRDFTLRDELYHGVRIRPGVTAILKTRDELLAWTSLRGRSRVVTTMLGHGPSAYEDPSFLKFLAQSLRWAAKR